MNNFYNKSLEESIKGLKTDVNNGLTTTEFNKRLAENGENKLEGKKPKSIFVLILEQFKDFLVIILMVAAIISVSMGDYVEGIAILAIIVMNAILGISQESKASNALKALKELSSPMAKVIRDGVLIKVASEQIVVGDIIMLDAGDYIPADLRLIETVNMKIDEAALTGESVPVEKDANKVLNDEASLGDRINSAYMGTVVTYGRGKGIVEKTGMQTQMGNIATMLSDTDEGSTPLQKKLDSFGKVLGIACIFVCILIFGLGLLRGIEVREMFMQAVALAVAAIPEGLTVVVTFILAMGMQKMVKINAIVKKLSAVETLGSTTVICSDKTGTLTQNKMTVLKIFDGENYYEVSGTGYNTEGTVTTTNGEVAKNNNIDAIINGAMLCNDSTFDKVNKSIIGDPTEAALLVVGEKYGVLGSELNLTFPRIQEIPFDSDRKLMSTFHNIDNKIKMFTKGAPDEILRRSKFIFKNNEILPLTDKDIQLISKANENYATNALRVLGVAFKITNELETPTTEIAEQNLVFAGLLGMIDPPREEVSVAIATCKTAGISVKMITGDHKITARAIAEQIGIFPCDHAIEGKEISLMNEEQLKEEVKKTSVFARVSPEHKVRLVEAIKANGNIVAMTGDGVNDAPSLKKADIGIAMGITGTDVSKEAADMILTDDNFATIVHSVEEGRSIYNNIRKVIAYLLSCNIGEILLILIAMLLGYPAPLGAIQLLSINLITDAFPAFALGMEAKEDGIMNEQPRDPNEAIVDKKMLIQVSVQSIALALGTLSSYIYGVVVIKDSAVASTMCFVTLVVGELFRAYSSRSTSKSVFHNIFGNSFLNKSVIVSLIFLVAAVYVGFMQVIFDTVTLNSSTTIIALGFSLVPVVISEIAKIFNAKR